ncbi:MAG: hypothetical protein EXQ74_05445 [Thermoleophilia bacterium]|nr:hypothetical protein [Thermoleophilia bacterium]
MSRRAWTISGASLIAVIVVVVLVVMSASGGSSSDLPSASSLTGVDTAVALTKSLPQSGFAIGTPGAPVTVTEFIDPQCPVCKNASDRTIPDIITGPVTDGTATLVIEPLTLIGSDSSTAAIAIAAAAQQNKAWPFTEILYANQGAENSGWATEELLTAIAAAVPGLDVAAWTTARTTDAVGTAVFAAADRAKAANVNATPTFMITGPGGTRMITGAVEPAAILSAIEAVR